ncbi:deoxyribonuclease IV [Paenibacillus doosanensis]|uniref:Endonuclease 4 n=1 Tax=Paenibacillus konkukensis TaxID=2020716 RepID=A0ABY4RHL2_9BACL|nr:MULTISPECIES: deoxyribonuclease IV [Paenibacillus]MCS7461140.1 deoxyribonuclease IV [Paenibacillus doosanensis]UQZ81638.1 putative endonuclease 4 [Paenibacillus konkukensis]
MYIGCHLSIRRGYLEAARTAYKMRASAYQYFPKNPRSLTIKQWSGKDAAACAAFCREHGIVSIAHSPYLTNLASEDEGLRRACVLSLRNDLEIAEACGSLGVVVHFGKYKGTDPLQGYKNIIQCLHEVLADWQGAAKLLIENQAGEGSLMGTTIEELVQIRTLSDRREHIGFCFDTCHAYASGLWPAEPGGWEKLQAAAERLGYFDHLTAVHLNDSRYAGGLLKDRHAMIGKGEIGEKRFRESLRFLRGLKVPVILETPVPYGGSHAPEIEYVRALAEIDAKP